MKACVLLYHFSGTKRGRILKGILVSMGVRIKNVELSEYGRPLGVLAGVLEAILTETNQNWNSREIYEELKKEHEMMHGRQ